MNGQAERCDRTAYVSGLQPTVSDIELFELFNRLAHVEKVIVRNGAVRHALVVFKTVNGLYQVLVSFQGTVLHGQQLHIRPLRESSHANSETIVTMFERAKSRAGNAGKSEISRHQDSPKPQQPQRPASAQETTQTHNPPPQYSTSSASFSTSSPTYQNSRHHQNSTYQNNPRGGWRNSSGNINNTGNSSSGIYSKRRYGNGYNNNNRNNGGYHSGNGGGGYHHNNQTYAGSNGRGGGSSHYSNRMTMFDNHPVQQYAGFNHHQQLQFDDYAEGAKRFDSLAHLIRSSTPTDPFANYHQKTSPTPIPDGSTPSPPPPQLQTTTATSPTATTPTTILPAPIIPPPRSRALSARDHSRMAPPTWKMELRIKDEMDEAEEAAALLAAAYPPKERLPLVMQEFMEQFSKNSLLTGDQGAGVGDTEPEGLPVDAPGSVPGMKKKRPNLSVINPSLFYEQYPRTSSPFAPHSTPNDEKNPSAAHDPAVLAFSRLRCAPQSPFATGMSPIDTDNCSFITKHLGTNTTSSATPALNNSKTDDLEILAPKRDLTNEELSDMIVSTGNLRINPTITDSFSDHQNQTSQEEPAPWSPLKRLRAESGSLSAAPLASPQFSPIKSKVSTSENHVDREVNDVAVGDTGDDDVFGSGIGSDSRDHHKEPIASVESAGSVHVEQQQQQKIGDFEDINNSRLPSNSHSAAPSSEQKSFVFPPEYPMCRHSSVPSIAHLVGDLSDFCPPSPLLNAGEKMFHVDCDDVASASQNSEDKTCDEKSSESIVVSKAPEAQNQKKSLEI